MNQPHIDAMRMNTRRHPRSMQDAFGPYTDNRLQPMRDSFRWTPVRVTLCITYAVALATLLVVL
jgi:hypothetical protein